MLLVTGATGNNGLEIVKRLSAQNVPVRAMVRDPGRASSLQLPSVELVTGDFDRPDTLRAALEGVERAFLVTPSSADAETQQLTFVEAARQSGVTHLVKLSQFAARADSPVRFLRYHAAVEQAIRSSGMAFTFLRPNLFMQGLLNFRDSIIGQNAFYAAAGDAKVSLVDVRDIADAAVAALAQSNHAGKTYDLTGPEALTHAEIAQQLSLALGRQITFVDITPDAMREALVGMHFPSYQAEGLLEDYAHYRRDEAARVTSGVHDATGREPHAFKQFARDYAEQFS